MKRLLLLLPLLLLGAIPARAQGGNSVTTRFAGAPTGGCNLFQYAVNNATGDLYDCKSGAWFKIGPGSSIGFCTPPGVNHSILIDDGAGDCGDIGSLGTTTTVLHGNASGDPTFGAVNLAADVSGQLPITAVGSAGLSGTSPVAISAAGAISCSTCVTTSTGTVPFTNIAAGTNTTSAMVLGTGSSLTFSGSGTNNASTLLGSTWAAPAAIGSVTPSSGTFTSLVGNTAVTSPQLICQESATPSSHLAGFALIYCDSTTHLLRANLNDAGFTTLAMVGTGCTNQFVTALSGSGSPTCTPATLASAQFANQGTTATVLHGNGAGNPSFGAVNLAADVSGQLPITAVGSAGLSGTAPVAISAAGAISCSTCNTSSATVSSIATTAPITGGTITTTGTIACATCATTTNGGALSGTAPVAISAAGAISITGAAGQVLAGATPAFTATPALGTDNSVAGTVQLANSAANAHTIFSSGATTTNTIQGFAAVPTTGRLIDCTVTSTTCLLHDSGISTSAVTQTIASGTSALGTGAISSGACATVVTTTATGTATTDNIMADFNADPTGVTGYAASANGMLTIIKYPTSNNVNFKVCNNTSASITPGAITLNFRVVR